MSFLKKVIDYYVKNLTGKKFVLVANYNLHKLFTGNTTRLKYYKNIGYQIKYDQKFRYFPTPECATYLYWNGVNQRGDTIGRSYFLDLIIFKHGDKVIDCGANLGDLKLYFDNIKVNIEYLAFEPNPYISEFLQKNISPSKHYEVALWDKTTIKKFFVSTETADSSLLEHPFTNEVLRVETKRLDDLEFGKIRLFKVEAEGTEIEVLMGAEKILKDIDYISADLGFERGMSQENTIPSVVNYLHSKNFELISAIAPSGRMTFLFKNLSS